MGVMLIDLIIFDNVMTLLQSKTSGFFAVMRHFRDAIGDLG